MSNVYVKKEMQGLCNRVSERRKRQRAKDECRRAVAAVLEFASNLFSMLGNAVGASTSLSGNSFNKHDFTLKDFNGEIAGRMFRAKFSPTASKETTRK